MCILTKGGGVQASSLCSSNPNLTNLSLYVIGSKKTTRITHGCNE